MTQLVDQSTDTDIPLPWLWRALVALEMRTRPVWGWGVLLGCMLLAMLPAVALRSNRWLDLESFQSVLEATGPLAVITVWLLWGWRRQERQQLGWVAFFASLLIGLLLLSQLLIGWIPGPRVVWQAAISGDWILIPNHVVNEWVRSVSRFVLWRDGVAAGGAAQDNLVFATFSSLILWLVGLATGMLARGVRQGFAAAVPSLWLLGVILLYSSTGRYLLVVALALTLALHILLDQGVLAWRWQQLGLDFSPGLIIDRMLAVLSAGAVILTVASVMPNLYIKPLVDRYYEMLTPAHLAMEDFAERLFPELRGTSRVRGGGTGMPNEFLLRGGPNLGSEVVMRVRTDEAASYIYPYEEMAAPPAHYMRGRTLTIYDGRGWNNPSGVARDNALANSRWEGVREWGRKQVVQSIILESNSTTLFAAPEPVEASVDARIDKRAPDDIVAVQAGEPSYTVVSMVPAVSEETLRSLPAWTLPNGQGDGPLLPEDLAIHLELPNTITERTRELALQLVEGQATSYDKALAIEQYLRQYEYDLDVSEPPAQVTDVADYFLFELQRGYCDYYATAFIVLARLAGLPTRFATGYSAGLWNPSEGIFVITESDAHSWPEVYFPEVGWVPFEPTAARSPLSRIGLPQSRPLSTPPPIVPAAPAEPQSSEVNWQVYFWVLPLVLLIGLVVMGVRWWWRRREDPWQAVLLWGSRVGRPMDAGETVLEYGEGLAGYVMNRQRNSQDTGRIAAREIQAVSVEVNRMRYGREDERPRAREAIYAHWSRLRNYLPLLRIR